MIIPDKKYLLEVVQAIEEIWWKERSLTVVGDGYLEDGTRVHLVKESLPAEPVMMNNAWVISKQEKQDAV